MTPEEHDTAYTEGQAATARRVLRAILPDMTDGNAERWRLERGEAVAALRSICAEHGDNNWPDELHLADAINKHLGKYLG